MSGMELEVQIWTEDLGGAVNLLSALVINTQLLQSEVVITQLRSVSLFGFLFFAVALHHKSNFYFPKTSVFKVRDPKCLLLPSRFPRTVETFHVKFFPALI